MLVGEEYCLMEELVVSLCYSLAKRKSMSERLVANSVNEWNTVFSGSF